MNLGSTYCPITDMRRRRSERHDHSTNAKRHMTRLLGAMLCSNRLRWSFAAGEPLETYQLTTQILEPVTIFDGMFQPDNVRAHSARVSPKCLPDVNALPHTQPSPLPEDLS